MTTDSTNNCGCPDYQSSRRGFLKGLGTVAGAAVVTSTGAGLFRQVSYGALAGPRNVLVVLSLRGGADGLSMVVPYGDPGYLRARPKIAVPEAKLLGKDGMFGLHPSFAPLMPLWNDGKMTAIHATGLPQPNRSHFAAMELLEDADPGSTGRVGWLNRLTGLDAEEVPTEALHVGSAMVPTSMYGPEQVVAIKGLKGLGLPGGTGEAGARKRGSLDELWATAPGSLGRAGQAALTSIDALSPLGARYVAPLNGAVYPKGQLGDSLADTARLIRAELGVEVVTVDYGNWDMHVGVGTLTSGTMAPMVSNLAGSLAAFFADLGALGANVTVVTVSEFGRRVTENGAYGADHGYGNAMMVLGGGVRGGRYYAQWPGLDAAALVEGDLAVTRDYRSVLSEVVQARFGADTSTVFPNFSSETPLGCMSSL